MLLPRKDTITRSTGRYFRFVEAALSTMKTSRLPGYPCKYSKKVYTRPQLLALIFFKDYLKKDYHEIIDLIVEKDRIRNVLRLSTIPYFTTLQKFLTRIKSRYLGFIFEKNPEIVLFHRGYNSPYCNRFFWIYELVYRSLLRRKNRKNPETFQKNSYRSWFRERGHYRIHFFEKPWTGYPTCPGVVETRSHIEKICLVGYGQRLRF